MEKVVFFPKMIVFLKGRRSNVFFDSGLEPLCFHERLKPPGTYKKGPPNSLSSPKFLTDYYQKLSAFPLWSE